MAGRILIADGSADGRVPLEAGQVAARHIILRAATGAEAMRIARDARPEAVLIAAGLPDIPVPRLCRRLREDHRLADLPVLVAVAAEERGLRVEALRAGADDVVTLPVAEASLLARIRNLARMRSAREELRERQRSTEEFGFAEGPSGFSPSARVALVSEDPGEATGWRSGIGRLPGALLDVATPAAALAGEYAGALAPSLFVLSGALADPALGPSLVSELRSRRATRHAAILVVANRPDTEAQTSRVLDLGADGLVDAGFEDEELRLRVAAQLDRKRDADRLRRLIDDGLRLAACDPLTGLYNRRYAEHHLSRIAGRAAAEGRIWAAMILDLDRFKQINDRHGHAAGDAVLRSVAGRLRDNLRPPDLVARLGGEEFLVALPDCDPDAGGALAQRLLDLLRRAPIRLTDGRELTVTASLGLALAGPAPADPLTVLATADAALYAAKAAGRDRFLQAPPIPSEPRRGTDAASPSAARDRRHPA
jgi:two-component system cell cycle response regulator